MAPRGLLPILLVAIPAGCLAAVPDPAPPFGDLAFDAPAVVDAGALGFEPSIVAARDGALYVTAHKAGEPDATRLASWLWWSADGGASWREVESPGNAHRLLWSFEGDVAVDDEGRLYFADVNGKDASFSRWGPGGAWEYTRPLVGGAGGGDRPWLAARGDGEVHLLMSTGGAPAPVMGEMPGALADWWIYSSMDAGETWTVGHGFVDSLYCHLEVSPADDAAVYVACARRPAGYVADGPVEHVLFESVDAGNTWTEVCVDRLDDDENVPCPFQMAVDRVGTLYYLRVGAVDAGVRPTFLGRRAPGGVFEEVAGPPAPPTVGLSWLAAGDAGTVAWSYYSTDDAEPSDATEWRLHTAVAADAAAPSPTWRTVLVDPEPVATGPRSPPDFFQNAVGWDNVVHVAYARVVERDPVGNGFAAEIRHARQIAGPNIP